MKLYIKQKVFSWGDKFSIYDENENVYYTVEGEVFTFGKKLHVFDANREECVFIHQKVLSLLNRYYINIGGADVAEVVQKFTFKPTYTVDAFGWTVTGKFTAHDYSVFRNDGVSVASVSKKWFTWGDTYEIDIADGIDVKAVLAVVLIIDACLASQAAVST